MNDIGLHSLGGIVPSASFKLLIFFYQQLAVSHNVSSNGSKKHTSDSPVRGFHGPSVSTMPTVPPEPEPMQEHVPAWKKLGLKLKFAKEEPENTQPRANSAINRKKRKVPAEDEAIVASPPVERSAKKIKKLKSKAEETGEAVNGNGTSYDDENEENLRDKINKAESSIKRSAEAVNRNPNSSGEPTNVERSSRKAKKSKVKTNASTVSISSKLTGSDGPETSPPPASKTTPTSKGKSVSFTPDTKTTDGDSVKGLYKTWIAKQIATDPSFNPSTVSPALRSIIPSTVAPRDSPSPITTTSTSKSESTTKDNKTPTKRKKTRLPKTSSGSGPSRFNPVLTYLTTHHTSPQTWKFSKPHQNQILKHLFSLKHIPRSYDPALLPYIRGLKGTSARSRIRKEALAVREEDKKWLASEAAGTEKMENETAAQCNVRRRRDYEAAVARIKQALEDQEDKREALESELLGENEEWEERCQKRRRAELVLWSVGEEEDEVAESHTPVGSNGRHMESGMAQPARAARAVEPAPRVGRGVGMGMGGVEVIDAGGIARGSRGKKVVFAEDGPAQAIRTNGFNGANGVAQAKRGPEIKSSEADNGAVNGIKPKRKRKRKRRTGVPDDDDDSTSSSSSSEEEHGGRPQKVAMQKRGETLDSDSDSDLGSGTSSSSGNSDSN